MKTKRLSETEIKKLKKLDDERQGALRWMETYRKRLDFHTKRLSEIEEKIDKIKQP